MIAALLAITGAAMLIAGSFTVGWHASRAERGPVWLVVAFCAGGWLLGLAVSR